MAILEVEHLEKRFGGTPVLQDVSFSLEQGQTLAILGSSGSGKTTLLRCLNALEQPDAGCIRVAGETLFDGGVRAAKRGGRLPFGLARTAVCRRVLPRGRRRQTASRPPRGCTRHPAAPARSGSAAASSCRCRTSRGWPASGPAPARTRRPAGQASRRSAFPDARLPEWPCPPLLSGKILQPLFDAAEQQRQDAVKSQIIHAREEDRPQQAGIAV